MTNTLQPVLILGRYIKQIEYFRQGWGDGLVCMASDAQAKGLRFKSSEPV